MSTYRSNDPAAEMRRPDTFASSESSPEEDRLSVRSEGDAGRPGGGTSLRTEDEGGDTFRGAAAGDRDRGDTTLASPAAGGRDRGDATLASPPAGDRDRGDTTLAGPPAGDRDRGDTTLAGPPAGDRDRGDTTLASPPAGDRSPMADGSATTDKTDAANGNGTAGDAPLVPQVDAFRTRWESVQIGFVDDPREAVRQADDLVAQVMEDLMASFRRQRGQLEELWAGGGDPSTDDLRRAFQRHRSFFDRLLSA